MARYTLADFLNTTEQRDLNSGLFELESERLLEANLAGDLWIKMGSMVAYTGNIRFTRERILERGLGEAFKKALTGEGAALTQASGQGKLYLADQGKKVTIIELQGESIVVNGSDLLAFEPSLEWKVTLMRRVAAMVAGGLFNVRVTGRGLVAITTHFDPLTLRVQPGKPVMTDPGATVAWSGNLEPKFRTDVQLKTFLGRGSGESVQMHFEGDGFVVVQPYEESQVQSVSS